MRIQVESKASELRAQFDNKVNELTQTQFKDIIAKRIEVYPELWLIAQTELSDLERAQKLLNPNWSPDENWAGNLLKQLMEWHQKYGVFLTQDSYDAFSELRNASVDLVETCNHEKRRPTLAEFQALDQLYYQRCKGDSPLATRLKNDLGSYKTPYISHPVDQRNTPDVTTGVCPKV